MQNHKTQNSCGEFKGRSSGKSRLWPVIPVLLVFAGLSIAAAIPVLRPTESPAEKRELTKFPKFTLESLASGEYFDEIGLWYSDTFPLREEWTGISARRSELYGFSSVVLHGDLEKGDEIPAVPITKPSEEPDTPPVPSPVPTEQQWGGLDVNAAGVESNNFKGIVQIGDSAFDQCLFIQEGADRYGALISHTADMLEGRATVYSILAPTSAGIMLPGEYNKSLGNTDQGLASDYMYSVIGDKAVPVVVYPTLIEHNSEYLYFRTDHHWTALAALYAYQNFCEAAKKTPAELSSFTEMQFPGFLGSFYWAIGGNSAMKANPDTVVAYYPPGDIEMAITNTAGHTFPFPVIKDMSQGGSSGQYLSFIAGDNPHTLIHNKSITDGSACLLIKESYGNCFAPFLTQNYEYVHVVDYRHYKAMQLSAFVDAHGIQDVVFLNALSLAEASGALGLLERFVG